MDFPLNLSISYFAVNILHFVRSLKCLCSLLTIVEMNPLPNREAHSEIKVTLQHISEFVSSVEDVGLLYELLHTICAILVQWL